MKPTFSLWRSGKLLGQFVERKPVTRHDKPVGAMGILEPTSDFVGFTPVFQTCVEMLPGKPVFQHPLEPVVLGAVRERTSGSQEPKPLGDEEARSVPEDLVLQIRDDAGRLIDTSIVTLQLFIIPDDVDVAEVYRANGLEGTSRKVWNVSFTTPPESEHGLL